MAPPEGSGDGEYGGYYDDPTTPDYWRIRGLTPPWEQVVQDIQRENPGMTEGEVWRRYNTGQYTPRPEYPNNPFTPRPYVAPNAAGGVNYDVDPGDAAQRGALYEQDPYQNAVAMELRRQAMESARIIPGAAPNLGVLKDGTIIDLQSFRPVDAGQVDPVTRLFADLVTKSANVPLYKDVRTQAGTPWSDLQGRGYRFRSSPEVDALAQRFLAGDQSVAAQLAQARMQSLEVNPRSNPTLDRVMRGLTLASIAGITGAALGPLAGAAFSPVVASAVTGAGVGGTLAATTSHGDPNAIWKSALVGGATSGIGHEVAGATRGLGPVTSEAIAGGARALTSGGLQAALNGEVDPTQLGINTALGIGQGAAGGALFPDMQSPWDQLGRQALGGGTSLLRNLINPPDMPGRPSNAQLRDDIAAETDQQAALRAKQAEWMRQVQERSALAQRAHQEALREWQQKYETAMAEYQAKYQAMLAARKAQVQQALDLMGNAEGGIASWLRQMETARAEAEARAAAEQQKVQESRQFFPSALLDQTGPVGGDFAQSALLTPHSPPPVQFGGEGLPASFASYGGPQPPAGFSGEGFLPSGSLESTGSPPAAAPLTRRRRGRYPTLMGGLTRSPYLMGV